MNRRSFSKLLIALGVGHRALFAGQQTTPSDSPEYYTEPSKKLPVRSFDVVVAGGGTAGVFAALAAARQGAKTMLIESKGYCGGIAVEGGTALHSFYNLYTAFEGCAKRQVVRGIPAEFIDRLTAMGGCSGYPEMQTGLEYDSICTNIDTERYKLLAMSMLQEAGVHVAVNTMLTDAIVQDHRIRGVITETHAGREAIMANCFIDSTGYGDLSARAGAEHTIPNDYACCNSFGMANASIDDYHQFLVSHNAVGQVCRDERKGREGKFVRMGWEELDIPGLKEKVKAIGLSLITTTLYDNYLMYVKCNYKVPGSVLNRDDMAKAEIQVRQNMEQAADLLRETIPGFENAFIARTSPTMCIRRGRQISCEYDLSNDEIVNATHFDDDVYVYGFHDMAPKYQIKDGGTYGIPYRALVVKNIDNLFAIGMMITSDFEAHMSTRNTVSCMGQGQAAGTAAAMIAAKKMGTRDLKYAELRSALDKGGVYFEG